MKIFPHENSEGVELRASGALSLSPLGRWKLGEWQKQEEKLLFLQGKRVCFSIDLISIIEIESLEREYAFSKKKCIKIVYGGKEGEKTFWLIVSDIKLFQRMLSRYIVNTITEDDVITLSKGLDHKAEALLWFLYRRRHANINELSRAIGEDNHMTVLNLIRKDINPRSEEIMGRELFIFRQSLHDITYNWWLTGRPSEGEPYHDIIDEGDFYRVIVEATHDAEVVANNGKLILVTKDKFKNTIKLPQNTGAIARRHYRNGILEIQLHKVPSKI